MAPLSSSEHGKNARRPGPKTVAAAGVGAVGIAAAAVAVHRYGGRRHPDSGPYGFTPDETMNVVATDGTPLHVEINTPARSTRRGRPTVVLCHGFALNLTAWVFQRRDLVDAGYRVVAYDQRNHGVSDAGDREHCTIEQLGQDLHAVIEAVAPDGPLVLVGHSMGGMTVMSFAGQYPEIIADRARAVALVSTSAGGKGVVSIGFGKMLDLFVVRFGPSVLVNLSARRRIWGNLRKVGREMEMLATKRFGFGGPVPKDLLRYTSDVIFSTPLDTIAAFLPHLDDLDVRDALAGLASTEVSVINGSKDELTPPDHSDDIVERLPHAEHVVVPGAGHLLPYEKPELVSREILSLIERGLKTPGATRGPRAWIGA